ncbi:MAG: acetate--CoA ligase family protein [Nitrososphaerales archaeon]
MASSDFSSSSVVENINSIFKSATQQKRNSLSESESKKVLKLLGLSVPDEVVVSSQQEATSAAERIGYPVVMKLVSHEGVHKSDLGGVIVGLRKPEDVAQAYATIVNNASRSAQQIQLEKVSIQSQCAGTEVIVGAKRDECFGPLVMFGMGGVLAELLRDVAIAICPLSQVDVQRTIRGIKGFRVLDGFRGSPKSDLASIDFCIRAVEFLVQNFDLVQEVEINPLIVQSDGKGAVAVDARVVLKEEKNSGASSPQAQESSSVLSGEAIRTLLEPSSVAVVGASKDPHKIGGILLSRILSHRFQGKVFVVNPSSDSISELKSFTSIGDIPEPVDVAFIALSPESAVRAMQECSDKGVKSALVYAGGFAESGQQGKELQHKLVANARRGKIRFFGPNLIGVVKPSTRLYGYFSTLAEDYDLEPGSIGFITQSGALGTALVSNALDSGIKISAWLSTGNEADLEWTDAVDYFVDDNDTKVIAAYVESIRNGSKLKEAAIRARKYGKPLIVFKSGSTSEGRVAARSHTSAMAVDDAVFNAFARQYGVIRAEELNDTFEIAKAVSMQPLPRGSRVAVISGSGAANVILADELAKRGLEVPILSSALQKEILDLLPLASPVNPVDLSANIMNFPDLLGKTVEKIVSSSEIDAAMVVIPGRSPRLGQIYAEGVLNSQRFGKTIIVVWLTSASNVIPPIKFLQDQGVPVYFGIETGARVLFALIQYNGQAR